MADFIQIKKDNILRIGIKDSNGNDTGEHLEFDLEDIELPLRINQCDAMHRKNEEYFRMQSLIIDKKEDKKGKFLLSWKEEEKIKLFKEFYHREMEALDLFLGKDGCKKLLNGRNPYLTMYQDFQEILEPIMPMINIKAEDIEKKIKEKYSTKKEENILE